MRRNPGCAVTGSVPAFTYASQSPVTRQLAGVLVEVGYIRYLAPMPPPAESTPTKVGRFHLLDRFCQVCSGVHSTTRVLHCNSGRTGIPYNFMVLAYTEETAQEIFDEAKESLI
jgi:hypothetical protein